MSRAFAHTKSGGHARPLVLVPATLGFVAVRVVAPAGEAGANASLPSLGLVRRVRGTSVLAGTVLGVDQPVRLPRAREARIPTDKLLRYALDRSHDRGGHKARVFASALGITASDWRYLHDQILEALPEAEVRATRITAFGVGYEVVVMIDGLNGATQPVVTTWIIEGDRPPRLTSTWVDIP